MSEGGQKSLTSGSKKSKSWACKVQHGDCTLHVLTTIGCLFESC